MKQHISKKEREEQKAQLQRKVAIEEKVLQFSKKRFKKLDEVVEAISNGTDLSDYYADRRIWKINDCFQKYNSKAKARDREVLKETFIHLSRYSTLMSGEDYIGAVFSMVRFRSYWIKDLAEWKPSSRRGAEQVRLLSEWLFCKYNTPEFLHKAFFGTGNDLFINWFMHIGTGGRVKDLYNLPVPFTQKMGHYFLQSPSKFSIPEAIRWSQVKGMGGDNKLAERFVYSWIGIKPYSDEEFWAGFIQLVINGGMFNYEKLTEIIDYVREEKRANGHYSLKGRNLQSLIRQSDEWHQRFSHGNDAVTWKPCGIDGYREEKKKDLIVIEELTEAALLKSEGKTMKHCVASYAFYCAKGRTAIFSLRKTSGGFMLDTLATIEVNLQLYRVVQAKAKMNRPISDEARKYLEAWAKQQTLTISPYL
ncbi:MAG: PcfJ domain-containing protein [Ferruginibacter sp.]